MPTASKAPYVVHKTEEIGDCLNILDIEATVPTELLPRQVRLCPAWRRGHGATWRQWYADHKHGMISLPDAPGDGGPSLRQLVDWLERHGYRLTSAHDEPDAVYTRS
jgi:hypothetical protein